MKKLDKLLKNRKSILFMDFEGTQYSHEMIAIGAVFATLDKTGHIKKQKKPFKIYVKAKNKIGKYVEELTGIKQAFLDENGVPFGKALDELKKYVGVNFKKCAFMTFGNHDLRILNQSISYNFEYSKEITSQIQKNFVDYAVFISEFIRDEKGNPLSLLHYCEKLGVTPEGPAHDPSVDAVNLLKIYDEFLNKGDLILEEYKKVLPKVNHFPGPIASIVKDLTEGKTVTPEDFDNKIKDYVK